MLFFVADELDAPNPQKYHYYINTACKVMEDVRSALLAGTVTLDILKTVLQHQQVFAAAVTFLDGKQNSTAAPADTAGALKDVLMCRQQDRSALQHKEELVRNFLKQVNDLEIGKFII